MYECVSYTVCLYKQTVYETLFLNQQLWNVLMGWTYDFCTTDKLTRVYLYSQIISSTAQKQTPILATTFYNICTTVNINEKWVHSAQYLKTTWEVSKMQRYKCAPVLHYAYSWHQLWHQSDTLQLKTEQENSDISKYLIIQSFLQYRHTANFWYIWYITLLNTPLYLLNYTLVLLPIKPTPRPYLRVS